MRILVVEDEFLLAALIADTLTAAGHEVSGPAARIGEALQLTEANGPEMAIVDLELRGGDSGIELARELQARGIPSVFATGQKGLARANRGLALGLVPKPYLPATLLLVVSWVEAAREGMQPARAPRGFEPFGPWQVPGCSAANMVAVAS